MNLNKWDPNQKDYTFCTIANFLKTKFPDMDDNNFGILKEHGELCLYYELFFQLFQFFCLKILRNLNFQFLGIRKRVIQIPFQTKFEFKELQLMLKMLLNCFLLIQYWLEDIFQSFFQYLIIAEQQLINKINKILNEFYNWNTLNNQLVEMKNLPANFLYLQFL